MQEKDYKSSFIPSLFIFFICQRFLLLTSVFLLLSAKLRLFDDYPFSQ